MSNTQIQLEEVKSEEAGSAPLTKEEIDKLERSKNSYAGWITRTLNQVKTFTGVPSVTVLQGYKGRISSQLEKLQSAHDKFISALMDEEKIEEAEQFMDDYFFKASQAIAEIDVSLEKLQDDRKETAFKRLPSASSDTTAATSFTEKPLASTEGTTASTQGHLSSSEGHSGSSEDKSRSPHVFVDEPSTSVCGEAIDAWIDELITGQETSYSSMSSHEADLSQAIARLEIERNLPPIVLPVFDGSPLVWPKFVEQFHIQVHSRVGLTDARRIDLLQSHVQGEAKKLIQGLGYSGRNYAQCLKELKFAFGHRIAVARAYMNTITSGGVISSGDPMALRNFYVSIRDCITTLQQMKYTGELTSSDILQRTSRRIPDDKRTKWNDFIRTICRTREPTLIDMKDWLRDCVEAEFSPYAIASRSKHHTGSSSNSAQTVRYTTLHTSGTVSQVDQTDLKVCPLCSRNHHISKCTDYANKSVEDRYDLVKSKRLCFNCLYPRHRIAACTSSNVCKHSGCGKKHHTTLHRTVNDRSEANQVHHVNNFNVSKSTVYFQMLHVTVFGKNGRCIDICALLDSGSDVTLIDEQLAKDLGLKGVAKSLTVHTMGSSLSMPSMCVSLSIKSSEEPGALPLWIQEAWTKKGTFNCPSFQKADVCHLRHLRDLNIQDVNPCDVKMLIGANVPRAHFQLDVRQGKENDPVAIHTPLGWCIMGGTSLNTHATVNFAVSEDHELQQSMEKFWATESFGVAVNMKRSASIQDQKALEVLECSTEFTDGHYEVPMLWKDTDVSLPDDRPLAERRYVSLTKKFSKDEAYRARYSKVMNNYIDKGYARKLTAAEAAITSSKTWYLPHHSVVNPKKPEKLRVVFDAAASFSGTSLNSQLVTGPDLLNNLFGVLHRFRTKPVALVADVADMFYQVTVPEADSDALRFLWKYDFHQPGPPDVYKMGVHIFGATDSPCCANYALRRAAKDCTFASSQTCDTINENFYVDDMLKSVGDVDTAVSLSSNISQVLSSRGFQLTKWMSSSKEVLSKIPQATRARPELDLDLSDLPVERALGIGWDVQKDAFVFHPVRKPVKPTKRGIVSAVSSIFDPLGFLTPYSFKAKCLIQDIWRLTVDWDELLPEDLIARWNDWQNELDHLQEFSIPRWFGLHDIRELQLHLFCDASEKGFASVAYLCFQDAGQPTTSFVAAKSHVAPVKQLTIPKLELQGAVMAVRLANTIVDELRVQFSRTVFWTDALTVLKYISNESRRWKIFVANRVAEIRLSSEPSQWKYVPSDLNPADLATRGMSSQELTSSTIWLPGPEFLRKTEDTWPDQPQISDPDPFDENLRKVKVNNMTSADDKVFDVRRMNICDVVDPTSYSSWHNLKKRTAWILRAVRNFLALCPRRNVSSIKGSELLPSDLEDAEHCLLRHAQRDGFPKEFDCLSTGRDIAEKSALRPLAPVFDASIDVIRVGSRIRHSPDDHESKYQILLPYSHHITHLIVQDEHVRLAHTGQEHLIASVRRKYWPIKCRNIVKKVIRQCLDCRRRTAKAAVPIMAALPPQRTIGYVRPFMYTGVDYFGPMLVKRYRARVKKWGCLFTCLSTRAVHLELADSLGTDDFLMVLRCFIARRGEPAEIFSDNGTNFVGAQRELKDCLAAMDQSRIHNFLLKSSIKWNFIPPHAPHFGGVWERLVRSVKSTLKAVLKEQCVSEMVLRTTLTETENVINSRPLTYNSVDPNDFTAITPNHFLRGDAGQVVPPGQLEGDELSSRKRWRQAQVLSDHMWNRWRKEYLPTLTARPKWNKETRNFAINDLVLLVEDKCPRGQWPLGRVVDVYPGEDKCVRKLKIKTSQGTYIRPTVKVCLLEESNNHVLS